MKLTHNIWLVIIIWLAIISLPISISKLMVFISNPNISSAPAQSVPPTSKQIIEYIATTTEETITVLPAGTSTKLAKSKWIPQTYNNCGPATTAMLLQHFGFIVSQQTIRKDLHKRSWDKNTYTYEIRDYLASKYQIGSKLLYNGTLEKLKLLLANGFYVIVEDWLHPENSVGHLALIRGYDDKKSVLIVDDSFLGTGITYPYNDFDEKQWKPFNREYLPVYKPEQEKIVKKIIGEEWDETTMYQNAIARNQTDITTNPNDAYAWFNIGTSYFGLHQYQNAKNAFEASYAVGWPPRMLWYQIQPVKTYNKLKEYENALRLITVGLKGNDAFSDLHFEAALAYRGLGDTKNALIEAEKTVTLAPDSESAQNLLSELKLNTQPQ